MVNICIVANNICMLANNISHFITIQFKSKCIYSTMHRISVNTVENIETIIQKYIQVGLST